MPRSQLFKNFARYFRVWVLLSLVAFQLGLAAQPTLALQAGPGLSSLKNASVEDASSLAPVFVPISWSEPGCDKGNLMHSIVATDAHTVTFNLCSPDAAFLTKLAMSSFSIYPQPWITATDGATRRTSSGLDSPVGTGPYKVSAWTHGTSLTLVRNPYYWGTPAKAATLVFRGSSDPDANLAALQAGTIDGYNNVQPGQYATINADPNLQLVNDPQLNTFYVGMNNTYTPFNDVRIRQAVAKGLDRQHIVDTYFPAGSEVATHFSPCGVPNGCVGTDWYAYNLTAAKALMTAAGYPSGFSTHLYYRSVVRPYMLDPDGLAQEVHDQLLANLGINATIVKMDSGAFIQAVNAGTLNGFFLLGWGADYPHVSNFLNTHFGQGLHKFGSPFPIIYDNLTAALNYADPTLARPYYTAANNAILDKVPMVPVAHSSIKFAYRADVTNPQATYQGNEYFALSDPGGRSTFNWTQDSEPVSLFCADEVDNNSYRACEQVTQPLYTYVKNGNDVEPALATACTPNSDLTIWTCALRQNIKFSDGSDFTANDVVATFRMGLNAFSPDHVGDANDWSYYDGYFGVVKIATTVSSIVRTDPNPTTVSSVRYTVNFSEPVTNVDPNDFSLTKTGITGGAITGVSGSGKTYTVTVSTGSGTGTLKLNVIDNDTILDAAGNPLGGPGLGNGNYTTGPKYTLDRNNQFPSSSLQDGWTLESGENSSVGGSISASGTLRVGDSALNQQYRSILSFSTATIPDTATIVKVTLKIKKAGLVGANPFGSLGALLADVRSGYFGTSAALEAQDFQTTASKNAIGSFSLVNGTTDTYQLVMKPADFTTISKTATTQFRLRFNLDDNNNHVADYLTFYAGDSTIAAYRPMLEVDYTLP